MGAVSRSIRVLIVDDHRMVRQGLRSLLAEASGVQVVGEAEDGRGAFQMVLKDQPDVVVMDVAMPSLNGVESTRLIKSQGPATKVIGLSMHSDRRLVLEMLRAGASGYVLKESAFQDLVDAIRTVSVGLPYLSPRIAGVVIGECLQREVKQCEHPYLPNGEREVLQLIAEGASTKEIAAKLRVSVKTVEKYRERIKRRIGLHRVAELTKYAVREGLTTLDTRERFDEGD